MLSGKELGAAIAEALRQNGKTQADAARYFKVSAPSVSGWLKTGRISKDNFDRLRVWLQTTPDSHWGMQSRPINYAAEPSQAHHAAEPAAPYNVLPTPTDDDFTLVPQLDIHASCGLGSFVDHVVVKGGLAFKKSSLRDFGVPEGAARIIYASGGSMEPTIQDGCVVLLNTAEREPREGRVYAICQPDGSLVLKRLMQDFIPAMGGQGWIMRSDNANKTAHPDKILPPDDRTMIVGRAVWNDNRL